MAKARSSGSGRSDHRSPDGNKPHFKGGRVSECQALSSQGRKFDLLNELFVHLQPRPMRVSSWRYCGIQRERTLKYTCKKEIRG
jgi:hypothetical protein